jgi:hypothetical protein
MPATTSKFQTDAASRPGRMIRMVEFYRGRCAKSTAYQWAREGKLRLYKVGGATYTDTTFDEFIERQDENGGAA